MNDALGEKGVCIQSHWAVQRSAENEPLTMYVCTLYCTAVDERE